MRKALSWTVVAVALYLAAQEIREGVEKVNQASRAYRLGVSTQENASRVTFANSSMLPMPATPDKPMEPLSVANEYLSAHKDQLRLQPYHKFKAATIEKPFYTDVRFSVYQDNLPVVGLNIDVNIAKDLSIISVENNYRPVQKADLKNSGMSFDEILKNASKRFIAEDSVASSASTILYVDSVNAFPELVYVLRLKEATGEKRNMQVLFRASDGLILGKSVVAADRLK
jgi:Zn-dependent metalloprotease